MDPIDQSEMSLYTEPQDDGSYGNQSEFRGRKGSTRGEIEFTEDTKHLVEHCLICTKMRTLTNLDTEEEGKNQGVCVLSS